jgi:type 1 glutamine amidotransferase
LKALNLIRPPKNSVQQSVSIEPVHELWRCLWEIARACVMDRSLRLVLLALAGVLQAPPVSAGGEAILVFTKTTGYRHESIPAAVAAVRALAARHGIGVEHSEDAGVFRPDRLSAFKAVAFVNTTGTVLEPEQRRALEAFIVGGGGYLGLHSAADTEYDWPWYGRLVGAWFKSHPPGLQTGTVRFLRPLGGSRPVEWRVTDEFYNFRSRPGAGATVVAALDESTYEGGEMGADHPLAWCQRIDGGRSWYTGLGHTAELFADATFLAHLEKGLLYATARSDAC